MSTEVIEKPKLAGPGTGLGGHWRIIVLNDSHNTFDGVAHILSQYIPGISLEQGYNLANEIHHSGQAIVWSGQQEVAELYWEQLKSSGLSLAPLEQG